MLISQVWAWLAGLKGVAANQQTLNPSDHQLTSEHWDVLGPFQIGTREAPWGADSLEFYGGFRNLEYDEIGVFRSAKGINGTISWIKHIARVSHRDHGHVVVELSAGFPELKTDREFLQARGDIYIHSETAGPFALHTEGILEFWIDDVHYYGGDFYGYGRAPMTLRLQPGSHRIDIRLVRNVRASGAVGAPTVEVKLRPERSKGGLELLYGYGKNVLMSEAVGGTFGPLASPYASIVMRNDAESEIYVHSVRGMGESCVIEMLSTEPIKLVPGQTRPVGFKIACTPSYDKNLHLEIIYTIDGIIGKRTRSTSTWPTVVKSMAEPHRVTFMHSEGMASYSILRAPPENCGRSDETSLPVLLALHGAGLKADDPLVRHALNEFPDLCVWVLFPIDVTPWSGDDWQ